jgi:hypothetical protein
VSLSLLQRMTDSTSTITDISSNRYPHSINSFVRMCLASIQDSKSSWNLKVLSEDARYFIITLSFYDGQEMISYGIGRISLSQCFKNSWTDSDEIWYRYYAI